MQRRRERRGFHDAARAIRIHEDQPVVEGDFSCGADAPVEIVEIRAAAEGHVLAVVDVLAAGQRVGRSTATEEGALFEQTHAEAGFSQRDGRGKPRQSAADHDHALRGHPPPTTSPNAREPESALFLADVRRTREENTSKSRSSMRASSAL